MGNLVKAWRKLAKLDETKAKLIETMAEKQATSMVSFTTFGWSRFKQETS